MWFQRLFGSTDHFAVSISFSDDPHPEAGLREPVARSWGTLKLWVRGACITSSLRSGEVVAEGIDCHVFPFLQWLCANAAPLLNEESFAGSVRREFIASAVDWMDASDNRGLGMTTAEEDAWFQKRWAWWERHALRAGLRGIAAPNLFFRRLADQVELSWDNINWGSVRPDITFVHQAGVARLDASRVADVVADAVRTTVAALKHACDDTTAFATAIATLDEASPERWLLPDVTRAALTEAELAKVLPARSGGLLARHNLATLLLRSTQLPTKGQVQELLALLKVPREPWPRPLVEMRAPVEPHPRKPWESGYERALDAREALGLGDQAVTPSQLAAELGLTVIGRKLAQHISAGVMVDSDQPGVIVNERVSAHSDMWSRPMMLATGLGHLLMDPFDERYAYLHSPTSDWLTGARAKAFGAMFLMPEDGVRRALGERAGTLDAAAVKDVMSEFGTGFQSTAYHLRNLGFMSETEHLALVASAAASPVAPGLRG